MKTTIITILAITSLNISLLSANNFREKNVDGPTAIHSSLSVVSLAPVMPAEATFEDAQDLSATDLSVVSFAPVTPAEASFDENMPQEETVTTLAKPEPPREATFGDEQVPVRPGFPVPCDAKYGCSL
jgi:hypothetical protein